MKLEEEVMAAEQTAPAEPAANQLTDEEEADLEIAVTLAKHLIDDGGQEIIAEAMNSSDPGVVVGQFLMQMVMQMNENLPEGVELSKRIYFAKDGWIEQISDFLQEEYDLPSQIADRAEMFIGAQAESMARGEMEQSAQGAPPQTAGSAPAAPAGSPPMPGGM